VHDRPRGKPHLERHAPQLTTAARCHHASVSILQQMTHAATDAPIQTLLLTSAFGYPTLDKVLLVPV
jgi:hypothetical protein